MAPPAATELAPVLIFVIAGEERECPRALWDALLGPKPQDDWGPCDGCTASPEQVGRYITWPACRIHDFQCLTRAVPRPVADLILRINQWRCVRHQGGSKAEAAGIAGPYWLGAMIGALLGIGRPERVS